VKCDNVTFGIYTCFVHSISVAKAITKALYFETHY